MFWISTDKAIPAFDDQIVKIKVASLPKSYVTEGWYDHEKQDWFSIEGFYLHDNVFAWKHTRKKKKISYAERQDRIAKWE